MVDSSTGIHDPTPFVIPTSRTSIPISATSTTIVIVTARMDPNAPSTTNVTPTPKLHSNSSVLVTHVIAG